MTRKFILAVLVVSAIGFAGWRVASYESKPDDKTDSGQQQTATFDKSRYSTSEPGSLWWIVNKSRPLPAGYEPMKLVVPDVPSRTKEGDESQVLAPLILPLEHMVREAAVAGHSLMLVSGYRSYALQTSVYNQNVRKLGQAEADKVSAKPGTSEHQTGLSFDIGAASRKCELEICFGDTPEGKWVAENAYKYGFIIRYPKGQEATTGYSYEPWHLRYVGPELAAELRRTNTPTLEAFFGL